MTIGGHILLGDVRTKNEGCWSIRRNHEVTGELIIR